MLRFLPDACGCFTQTTFYHQLEAQHLRERRRRVWGANRIPHLTLADANSDLPSLVRTECLDLIAQVREQTARIEAKTKTAKDLVSKDDVARRLQTMPGDLGAAGDVIRPAMSILPDCHLLGVNPAQAPTPLLRGKRFGSSPALRKVSATITPTPGVIIKAYLSGWR